MTALPVRYECDNCGKNMHARDARYGLSFSGKTPASHQQRRELQDVCGYCASKVGEALWQTAYGKDKRA